MKMEKLLGGRVSPTEKIEWRFFRKDSNPNLFLLEHSIDYPTVFKDLTLDQADDILRVYFWLIYKKKFSFKEWITNPKNITL